MTNAPKKRTAAKKPVAPPLDQSKVYDIDFDDMDLGETEELFAFAQDAGKVNADGDMSLNDPAVLRFMVWLVERRDNPARTFDECKKIKNRQITALRSGPDPKD